MTQVPSGQKTQWQPVIPVDQGIYEESTTKKAQFGTEIVVGMRKFRYAAAATNLNAGDVLVAPVSTNLNKNTCNAAAAIGVTSVNVYASYTIEANAMADGFLLTKDSGGQGYLYAIKSHPAIAATTSGQTITLYDPLVTTLTTASVLELIPNPYSRAHSATQVTATSVVIGIAPVAVTSGNYFWAQVGGPAAVKVGGSITYGNKACAATTGGALVIDATLNATAQIGVVLSVTGTALDHVCTWVGEVSV